MTQRHKTIFLTVDAFRVLQAKSKKRKRTRRITRTLKQNDKSIAKVVKEKTILLSTRIPENTYHCFVNTIGYDRGADYVRGKTGNLLSKYLSEAMILWLAHQAIYAKRIVLSISEFAFESSYPLWSELRRKYRTGTVADKSPSYSHLISGRDFMNVRHATIDLPRLGPMKFERRLKFLIKLIKHADVGIYIFEEHEMLKKKKRRKQRKVSKLKTNAKTNSKNTAGELPHSNKT